MSSNIVPDEPRLSPNREKRGSPDRKSVSFTPDKEIHDGPKSARPIEKNLD